jgi:hypothetical protein
MDKLYLGPDDDTEVNDLLAQLGDESLLKLTVNTHTSTDGVQSGLIEDPSLEPSYEGINSDLAARYASLKAPHPPATKKTSAGSKAASANKGDDYASSKRSSKPKKGDTGESSKRLSSQEIETDLNAELLARLQALKGPSHSILVSPAITNIFWHMKNTIYLVEHEICFMGVWELIDPVYKHLKLSISMKRQGPCGVEFHVTQDVCTTLCFMFIRTSVFLFCTVSELQVF